MATAAPAGRPVTVPCAFCGRLNRVDIDRLAAGPKCAQCGRPIRLDRPLKVTDGDFDCVIGGSSLPIVLDCYADWCGPCRMMAPTLDEFALEFQGQVLVLKLDTDRNPATTPRLGIRGIPTLIAYRGGQEQRRHVGLADRSTLEALAGVGGAP
ncbi:MAG TPA: thioredoxin domain-containing protein [Gemmatimonadales bacterium]|nr:thioredoxin domain-containing protein [Gemmatimonadales bacterium]